MAMKTPWKLYMDNGFLVTIENNSIKIWQVKINGLAYSHYSNPFSYTTSREYRRQ